MSGYVGRFAPSPTGPLHAGSVIAALGSYLEAKRAGGRWLLRIDDIDPPRAEAGAAARILRQLEALGFEWDGPVIYQSARERHYGEALAALHARAYVYGCRCSRRSLAAAAPRGPLGPVYPGTCRGRHPPDATDSAVRVQLPPGRIALLDRLQGDYGLDAVAQVGDPIVRRRDGLWAYHLATTVDDALLGVTDVVRGADLLPSALIQVALQGLLGLPALSWCHLPVVIGVDGDKLSKQTGAPPVDERDPLPALLAAWARLGQPALPETPARVAEFHAHARAAWQPGSVPAGPIPTEALT